MGGEQAKAGQAAMEGNGFYNRNSAMQAAGLALAMPLWEKLASTVPVGDEPLVIADYAAAQGRNSFDPMRIAIRALRAGAGAARPVEVIHTDLPSNDFASLFEALEADPDSYMAGTSGIFPYAVGRSYYDVILPPARVHLAWNSWSLQWMSRNPLAPDHIFAKLSAEPSVVAAVAAQQADDLQRFLEARAAELRAGAKMLCLFPGATSERMGWEWFGGKLWESVLEMGTEGLLSKEEQLRLTLPTAPRSQVEIGAPFAAGRGVAGLKLEHVELHDGVDPFWSTYEANGDPDQLGRSHADWCRAWARPTLVRAINPGRDGGAVIDDLLARFAVRVAAAPGRNENFIAVAIFSRS